MSTKPIIGEDLSWTPSQQEVISRRESLADGSKYPMNQWDSTEWEEFLLEIKNMD